MTQISKRPLDKPTEKRIYEIFLDVISDVRSHSEVQALMEDFFTPTERIMLPKRLCIAFLLIKGYDQRNIASYLKVSFTTINRVSTALKIGGTGYSLVINRLQRQEQVKEIFTQIENGIIGTLASIGGPSRVWKNLHNAQQKREHANRKPF